MLRSREDPNLANDPVRYGNQSGKNEQVAGVTGLEPATSGVTGRRSNQLSYTPKKERSAALRRFASV